MKDYSNHTHRAGISLKILLKPHVSGYSKLADAMELLQRFTENLGADLDYNPTLMSIHTGADTCLVVEHERTRNPGRDRDETYRCFRDDAQAERYLAGKLTLIRHLAEALELDVQSYGPYHETL
jgi:hypothetical protein